MKFLLLFSLLLAGCTSNNSNSPYKNLGGTDLYYEFKAQEIAYNCENDKKQNNCLCSIKTKSSPQIEWIFRRAKENEWCQDFSQNMKKLLAESNRVKILGYDLPSRDGKVSKLQYFGAIKGLKNCIEWFEGDCKTF